MPDLLFLNVKSCAKQNMLHLAIMKSLMLWHLLFRSDAIFSLDLT